MFGSSSLRCHEDGLHLVELGFALIVALWVPVFASESLSSIRDTERPKTIQKELSCRQLPDIPSEFVTTMLVTFPPNAFTPKHIHGGSVVAYVLSGKVRSQLAEGPIITYERGETWFEPKGVVHDFAENASSTKPARLLATFIANRCGALTTYL